VDIERDILARMDFAPIIRSQPRLMAAAIFDEAPMDLRTRMLEVPLPQRLSYDAQQNILFINFERLAVRNSADVAAIKAEVEARLASISHRVYAIVNYDSFELAPEVEDEYAAMVKALVERYYDGVSRYSTSGFLRAKLGRALKRRGVAPHIYESPKAAFEHVRDA
jgi:propionate CoA-transferase